MARPSLLAAGLLLALAGCQGASGPRDEGAPGLAPTAAPPERDDGFEHALAIARAGVPSPTPELDALVAVVEGTTPDLGLEPLLSPPGAPAPARTLRPGDLVDVVVFGRDELSGALRVGLDGSLSLAFARPVPVTGSTPAAAAEAVRAALDDDLLRAARVHVALREAATSHVRATGRLRGAGAIELPREGRLTAYGLIARAQGLELDADGARLALLRQEADGRQRCHHFTHDELVAAHLAGREAWLQPDDELVVPRLLEAQVLGAVQTPGGVPLRPGSTPAALLTLAGGLTPDADGRAVKLLTPKGEVRAADPGAEVAPGEVVFVPRRQRVHVVGPGVVRSGPIDLPASGLTVLQAIAEAGWLAKHARPAGVEVLRFRGGKQARIPVPLDDLIAGRGAAQDVPLEPGDLVYVPETIW